MKWHLEVYPGSWDGLWSPISAAGDQAHRINDSGGYYQVLIHLLLQEDVLTYTAEHKKPTPQLHSEGTAACNHILLLHNKTANYKLCIKEWVAVLLTILLLYHSLSGGSKDACRDKTKGTSRTLIFSPFPLQILHPLAWLSEQGWNSYLILYTYIYADVENELGTIFCKFWWIMENLSPLSFSDISRQLKPTHSR